MLELYLWNPCPPPGVSLGAGEWAVRQADALPWLCETDRAFDRAKAQTQILLVLILGLYACCLAE